MRHLLISQNQSFRFGTVISHPSKIDEISNVVNEGYSAYLYFICTDSPVVNVSRVKNRVEKGGHEVPENKIVDRYFRALNNLHLAIEHCYRAYIFDDSGRAQILIAEVDKGVVEIKANTLPNWFRKYALPHLSK